MLVSSRSWGAGMRSAYGLASDRGVDWLLLAACRGLPYQWWETGSESNAQRIRDNVRARAICRTCPVIEQCADQARRLGADGTVRAGMTWPVQRTATATSGALMPCSRPGCRDTYTTSVNGRRKFCSKACRDAEYHRLVRKPRRHKAVA